MNKSEIELENLTKIIKAMPRDEGAVCVNMIRQLLASVGDPITGKTFMVAVAYVNTQCAVSAIAMGLVNPDGSAGTPDETPEELAKMGQNAQLHGRMAIGQGLGFEQGQFPKSIEIPANREPVESQVFGLESVGTLKRSPIGPGAEPRRKQSWPQYGMTHERYRELNSDSKSKPMTRDEIRAGWFFDSEYDGLLVNRAWPGHK